MISETFDLWENTPGLCEEIPTLTAYIPDEKRFEGAVVILPGGGYTHRADYEGKGYAEFLAGRGITAFVCEYRVYPHMFPLPLLDARRAMRTVRFYAEKYGICKDKIAIMGSSAGGHLAALTATYNEKISFEDIDDIDNEDYRPNAHILCYPVIKLISKSEGAHIGSCEALLGNKALELGESLTPELIATENTPPCFIWHTFEDNCVSVRNSLDYANKLRACGVPTELHIFPNGNHGLGLPLNSDDKISRYISKWGNLLVEWLEYMEYKCN